MDRPVYLDHNATTPLAPGVLDTVVRYLGEEFGNPSSSHHYGDAPRQAVATARTQLAGLVGANANEIVFTGCATEANTLALHVAQAGHVITQASEHPAILNTCQSLAAQGIRVTTLGVDEYGRVSPDALAAALRPDTVLVSIMHANNETGSLQPIAELAAITHRAGALFHTDAAQTVGKIAFTVSQLGVDLLTVAGHKFGAPKGVGALYIRDGVTVPALLHGGGQEHGLRSGTENVAGIAGLGAAAAYAHTALGEDFRRMTALRDRLHERLREGLGDRLHLNGHPTHRLPSTLNVSIAGTDGAQLLAAVPQIAASTGSACHDDSVHSPVLSAMGLTDDRIRAAIRLSVGRATTPAEIDDASQLLIAATDHLAAGRPG